MNGLMGSYSNILALLGVTAYTKKKGRLRCHKRPKSREETPKEGSDSAGGSYRMPLVKTIAISGQLSARITDRYQGLWRSPLWVMSIALSGCPTLPVYPGADLRSGLSCHAKDLHIPHCPCEKVVPWR
jgi:hypothetical protein